MKVIDVKPFVVDCFRTNWVFVKVYTDEGIDSVGEATLEYKEAALLGAVQHIKEYLVGKNPLDIERHFHDIYRDAYWRGGAHFQLWKWRCGTFSANLLACLFISCSADVPTIRSASTSTAGSRVRKRPVGTCCQCRDLAACGVLSELQYSGNYVFRRDMARGCDK